MTTWSKRLTEDHMNCGWKVWHEAERSGSTDLHYFLGQQQILTQKTSGLVPFYVSDQTTNFDICIHKDCVP